MCFASSSSSIEYANAGHAVRNAVSRSTIAEAIRTPISYRPTSSIPAKWFRKKRSPRFIAINASAAGTSGMPKRFISRSSGRENENPSCARR